MTTEITPKTILDRLRKAFATCGVTAGILAVTAFPASAGTHTTYDRRGDAPARADILKVRVTRTTSALTAMVKVRRLTRGNSIGIDLTFDGDGGTQALVHRTASGQLVARLVYYREANDLLPCAGQTARWRKSKNLVVISTPLECFEFGAGTRATGVAYRNVPTIDGDFFPRDAADHTASFSAR